MHMVFNICPPRGGVLGNAEQYITFLVHIGGYYPDGSLNDLTRYTSTSKDKRTFQFNVTKKTIDMYRTTLPVSVICSLMEPKVNA